MFWYSVQLYIPTAFRIKSALVQCKLYNTPAACLFRTKLCSVQYMDCKEKKKVLRSNHSHRAQNIAEKSNAQSYPDYFLYF